MAITPRHYLDFINHFVSITHAFHCALYIQKKCCIGLRMRKLTSVTILLGVTMTKNVLSINHFLNLLHKSCTQHVYHSILEKEPSTSAY